MPDVRGCTYLEPGLPDIAVESATVFLAYYPLVLGFNPNLLQEALSAANLG